MAKRRFEVVFMVMGVACAAGSVHGQEADELPWMTTSSAAYLNGFDSSAASLEALGQSFSSPTLGSLSGSPLSELAAAMASKSVVKTSEGDVGIYYDVILQPGHYGRTQGRTGTAGKYVSEQRLVAYITGRVADALRLQGVNVLVIDADHYKQGLRGEVFLAIHADGNIPPCGGKPSLGYDGTKSVLAMHAVGFALGQALGQRYDTFHKDNFTANERQYYMFRTVQAQSLTGLLEVGELTCPASEEKLLFHADRIAGNLAKALHFITIIKAKR